MPHDAPTHQQSSSIRRMRHTVHLKHLKRLQRSPEPPVIWCPIDNNEENPIGRWRRRRPSRRPCCCCWPFCFCGRPCASRSRRRRGRDPRPPGITISVPGSRFSWASQCRIRASRRWRLSTGRWPTCRRPSRLGSTGMLTGTFPCSRFMSSCLKMKGELVFDDAFEIVDCMYLFRVKFRNVSQQFRYDIWSWGMCGVVSICWPSLFLPSTLLDSNKWLKLWMVSENLLYTMMMWNINLLTSYFFYLFI